MEEEEEEEEEEEKKKMKKKGIDTRQTNPGTDPTTPDAWQGSQQNSKYRYDSVGKRTHGLPYVPCLTMEVTRDKGGWKSPAEKARTLCGQPAVDTRLYGRVKFRTVYLKVILHRLMVQPIK